MAGSRIGSHNYDAFGNEWMGTQPDLFGYLGEYYDSESEMTYLGARYYDSNIKRFISEDPIKDGLNWYAYANNNPIKYIDPSGLVITLSGTDYTYTTQNSPKEELATVGLKHNRWNDITENMLRREHGLNLRGAY